MFVLVPVRLPGFEVAVYNVIGLPPLDTGAVKLTVACAFPATADTAVGDPGNMTTGVTLLEAAEGTLVPLAFVAFTVKV